MPGSPGMRTDPRIVTDSHGNTYELFWSEALQTWVTIPGREED